MGWRSLLTVSLVVAACSGSTVESTTTSTTEPATTTTTVSEAFRASRLAVIDVQGNVVVMAPDGSDRVELTDDGGVEAVYSQPTWSPSGSGLSWGQVSVDGFALGVQSIDGGSPDVIPMSNLPFYMFWSPSGTHVAALHNGSNGIDFEMVDVGSSSTTVVGTGAPFYFSWSPAGDRVVTHVGESGLAYVDLVGDATGLEPTGREYLAPQWTDRGVVHVVDGALVMETADGERSAIASVEGLVTFFVANRDGSRIAVQTLNEGGGISVALAQTETITANEVWVIDVESGDVQRTSPRPALAFFWSPAGDTLLMMVASGNGRLVPVVWDEDVGSVEYTEFAPSPNLVNELLPFFPQYAQSMTLWSPDSSAFTYPGEVGLEEGVWVQSAAGGEPVLVSDGVWVSWSP